MFDVNKPHNISEQFACTWFNEARNGKCTFNLSEYRVFCIRTDLALILEYDLIEMDNLIEYALPMLLNRKFYVCPISCSNDRR